MVARLLLTFVVLLSSPLAQAETRTVIVKVFLNERLGPLETDKIALGQGGLSEEPMSADRIAEIRALRPGPIRLFIQEYFDLLPARGKYPFETLDRSVDLILNTGAKPLMSINFKPSVLFPVIAQDIVEPNDYEEWERLIFNLVGHYRERGAGIRYWEIANEPDIGEDGGCRYRFSAGQLYALLSAHRCRGAARGPWRLRRRAGPGESGLSHSTGASRFLRDAKLSASLCLLAHLQQRPAANPRHDR